MEIPASYAYDYTDRKGFTPLLKMHTLRHSSALNAHGYFNLFAYDAFLAGKLKDFAYSEKEVEEAMAEPPKISSW